MQYGLLGERLGHSFSPQIHKELGGYEYELCPTALEDVAAFMQGRNFKGLNVTIPYKKTVIPYCDMLTDRAKSVGAVNTLYFDDDRLVGENTDYFGFSAMAARAGISFMDKRVIILGSGGASATAQTVARDEGAARIAVISRTKGCGYGDLPGFSDWDIIVNTTPVGMFPDNYGRAVDLGIFTNLCGVIDVVYNPLRTQLILDAEDRGIKCAGGLYMLVAQAKRAAEIFSRKIISQQRLDEVFGKIENSVTNIVLIGMPGCGKSSIARRLSERLGREVVDTDAVIVEESGMSIPDIFAKCGEAGFRDLETQAIKKCAAKSGIILATGGGSILREENRRALRQNGRIFMIDRSLDRLQMRNGRPLSKDRVSVERLYSERDGIYRALADGIIDNNGSISDAAEAIVQKMNQIGR